MDANNILSILFSKNDANCPVFLKNKLWKEDQITGISFQEKIHRQVQYIIHVLKNNRSFISSLLEEFLTRPEEIPDQFLEHHWKERLQRGEIEDISEENKEKFIETHREQAIREIVKRQKRSLLIWVNYLASSENDHISPYIRYWIFKRMLGLGSYDREKKSFERRNKACMAPFPELNREALHNVVEKVKKHLEQSSDPIRFKKLYSAEFCKLQEINERNWENTRGKWVSFSQYSDAKTLVKKLAGKNTGLCIANLTTAENYLKQGTLEVYFSENKKNELVNPRIAIHIVNGIVHEVRGVDKDQNPDPYIHKILKEKLQKFTLGNSYFIRCEHMEKLGNIYEKNLKGLNLSKDELVFLYEIKDMIQSFGYLKDPRIAAIINSRNIQKDLACALDCSIEEISIDKEQALQGNIRYHFGDLDLSDVSSLPEGVIFPEEISEDLRLDSLTKFPHKFTLPKVVLGELCLNSLVELPKDVVFPEVLIALSLDSLAELPNYVVFPEDVNLSLNNLVKLPKNFIFPEGLGDLSLNRLMELSKNVVFPKIVSNLSMNSVRELPKNFVFPKIFGELHMDSLVEFPKDIDFPETISNFSLNHDKLKKASKGGSSKTEKSFAFWMIALLFLISLLILSYFLIQFLMPF